MVKKSIKLIPFLQIEDCINKIILFQQQHSSETTSKFLLRFSLMQDATSEDDRIVIKVPFNESCISYRIE